jgi:hypothetical protein
MTECEARKTNTIPLYLVKFLCEEAKLSSCINRAHLPLAACVRTRKTMIG